MRKVRLSESRQVKLLFHCVPTADFNPLDLGIAQGKTHLWLKIQDIAPVFSP